MLERVSPNGFDFIVEQIQNFHVKQVLKVDMRYFPDVAPSRRVSFQIWELAVQLDRKEADIFVALKIDRSHVIVFLVFDLKIFLSY